MPVIKEMSGSLAIIRLILVNFRLHFASNTEYA